MMVTPLHVSAFAPQIALGSRPGGVNSFRLLGRAVWRGTRGVTFLASFWTKFFGFQIPNSYNFVLEILVIRQKALKTSGFLFDTFQNSSNMKKYQFKFIRNPVFDISSFLDSIACWLHLCILIISFWKFSYRMLKCKFFFGVVCHLVFIFTIILVSNLDISIFDLFLIYRPQRQDYCPTCLSVGCTVGI